MPKSFDNDRNQTALMMPGERAPRAPSSTPSPAPCPGKGLISSLTSGSIVDKYRIVRPLGHGGQGKVFLAEDIRLGRLVALKTVSSSALISESALQRFRNEARAVANLHSPNIVRLHDVFETDGVPFLAMEFVEGDTLLARCQSGALNRREIVSVIAQCCEAMGQAHGRGLIHRDLKPQNIMITHDGEPKIMDFGLATSIADDTGYSAATVDGQVVGSPAYMSPEQASGERDGLGPQSDVFALGTVLYQCLSDELPHAADTPMKTIYRVIHDDPEPLTSIDPSIGDDLNAICMKALEKSPRRRYADASEMAVDLRRWLAEEPVLARPSGVITRVGRAVKRNGDVALIAGVAAAFLAVAVGASLWLFTRQSARQAVAGLQAELKTVANTAALMFNAAEMDRIIADAANPGDDLRAAVLRLNEIRCRNPRVRNAWLFRVRPGEGRLNYVADADALRRDGNSSLRVGEEWIPPDGSLAAEGVRDSAVENQAVEPSSGDRWTAYAPVTNERNEVAGLLAVEVDADEMRVGMKPAVRASIQAGGVAALLFLGFTALAAFRVLRGRTRLT